MALGRWLHPLMMEDLCHTEDKPLYPEMWFSPSVISVFCPRAWTIAYREGLGLVDRLGPDNRWWMDTGTALHSMLQEKWLGPSGRIRGGWKCHDCGHVHGVDPDDKVQVFSHRKEHRDKVTISSAIHMPGECEACGMVPDWRWGFVYVEPLLYDLDLRVAGWTDGILDLPGQPPELVDFKVVGELKWVTSNPKPEHVIQLTWYLDMAGLPRGRIVYIDRTAKHLADAIKEHIVFHDEKVIQKEKEKVRALREALKDEEAPLPDCPHGGKLPWGPCDCAR